MYSRDFAMIYLNMLISLYIVGKSFTKLKFITKFFDKPIFSKSLKIIKISELRMYNNVGRWFSLNKGKITLVSLKYFWQKGEKFQPVKKCLPHRETQDLMELICYDVTFLSAVRTLRNTCIHEILLESIIIC